MLFFEENVLFCSCVKLTRIRRDRYIINVRKRSIDPVLI